MSMTLNIVLRRESVSNSEVRNGMNYLSIKEERKIEIEFLSSQFAKGLHFYITE